MHEYDMRLPIFKLGGMKMMENKSAQDATSKVGEREFVMEKFFDVPRELVFKAFTKPEHISRWWAPADYTIPVCKIDLRPGGVWHYCMRSPKGEDQWVKAIYREIVDPERIVYTVTFADEHANPVDVIPEQLGTITFTELDGKTKLTVRFEFASESDLKTTVDMGMIEGLTITLNQLADYLEEIRRTA
jgi:uncharacterized protein YndB with AHSA1/START domain